MSKPNLRETCQSCGEPWAKHLGIFGTCAKLQIALRALRSIALVEIGNGGNGRSDIAENKERQRIAVKALKEIR